MKKEILNILPHRFKELVEQAPRYYSMEVGISLPNKEAIRKKFGYPSYVLTREVYFQDDLWVIAIHENAFEYLTNLWNTEWEFDYKIYIPYNIKTFQDSDGEHWVSITERSDIGSIIYPQVGRGNTFHEACIDLEKKL